MMRVLILMVVMAVEMSAYAVVSISNVKAKQRFPWNGLVDVTYATSGATSDYKVKLSAYDTNGKSNLPVRVVWTPGGLVTNNPVLVAAASTHVIWNAAADLPSGFVADGIAITAEAYSPEDAGDGLYCVIELAAGSSALTYPVSYLDAVPEGGWTDEYKTTKLVLRKISPGTFMMGCRSTDYPNNSGGPTASDVDLHLVTLTTGFFVGVFPVTQKQFELVMGWNPSTSPGDGHPVDFVSYANVRGNMWPKDPKPDNKSFLAVLSMKTCLDFDLPTEAQWEYACRAGTNTALNNGKNLTYYYGGGDYDFMSRTMRGYFDSENGTAGTCTVGSYEPNKWGLYDCHGNVWEWCLDYYSSLGGATVTDPVGSSTGSDRVLRGGSYKSYLYACRSGYREMRAYPSAAAAGYGFRIVRRLP